ncbi:MAG: hypothetical protein IPJ65_04830 [Archangiaceae bacterium]|nr:hypothetical protein [Archangiaceae bacterium]
MSAVDFSLGGEDEGDAAQRFARTLLARTAIAIKLSTMHALDNAALNGPLAGWVETTHQGVDESGTLVMQVVGDNFFLNGEVIKLDFSSYEAGQTMRQLLARVGAHEIAFLEPPSPVALREFLAAYQKHARSTSPQAMLNEKFDVIRVRAISRAEQDALAPTLDGKTTLLRGYAHLAIVIEAQLALMKQGKHPRMAKLRRAIHGLADAAEGQQSLLVALTRFDAFAGAVHFHLTATTALTLLLAQKLGLSRTALSEACLAAALHDFALDEVPPPRDEKDTREELEALKRVPLRTLLRLTEASLGSDALERLAATFEVTSRPTAGATTFGHLIAVPCVFDRLTRPRPPRKALLPDHALRLLYNQVNTRFDERIVRLFAGTLGLYPVGTTVKLNSGELALVIQVSGEPNAFARPRVKVFRTAQGQSADYLVDLMAPNEKRGIVSSIDASELQLNVPQFLLA